jgi:hypothetical protein
MAAGKLTLDIRIFPQLNQASTLLQFNEAVSELENFFSVHTSLLDKSTLETITVVFSSALTRLQNSLRLLHEIEEYPYNRFNSRVFRCMQTYGQTALNARVAICTFLEACDKAPRRLLSPPAADPVISEDGTTIYRDMNILDLLPAGKCRFENCEIYGSRKEKDRLDWSRVTHLTFVNHQGTNLRLTCANKLQVLICENNAHLRTLNERVMVINGLPKLNRMVLINNPMLEEHDLQCFFDTLFVPRAREGFSFELTLKNTPAFSDNLILFLQQRGLTIPSENNLESPDEVKTYLISYSPSHRSEDSAPVSTTSGSKSRGLFYGVLAVCFILGVFAPRLFRWALRLKTSFRNA